MDGWILPFFVQYLLVVFLFAAGAALISTRIYYSIHSPPLTYYLTTAMIEMLSKACFVGKRLVLGGCLVVLSLLLLLLLSHYFSSFSC